MNDPNIYNPPSDCEGLKESKADWWRWPLVPIGSVIGASLGAILIIAINWFVVKLGGERAYDGWFLEFVRPFMIFGLFGFLWTTLSYWIAPRGKLITAVVMATILGMLCLFAVIRLLTIPDLTTSDKIMTSLAVVASLIGGIFGVLRNYKEDDSYRPTKC